MLYISFLCKHCGSPCRLLVSVDTDENLTYEEPGVPELCPYGVLDVKWEQET